ncbi:hypothetical protein NNO_0949 [Hydrogenimonas sp.]|nr:hypothetical protein NNO_0949 [Hydrogenimonas sp.]
MKTLLMRALIVFGFSIASSPAFADSDSTATAAGKGMMNEMSGGFPHPFFNHMGIPDMPGMVSARITAYRQGESGEASREDFGFHLEAGLYERLGLHIRNNEIRQSNRTDVMLMYAVVQDSKAESGISVFGGALIPSGTVPEGEDSLIGAFGISGRQVFEDIAIFDGNVHYMPQMKMYEMGFSGIFKASKSLFPMIEIDGKITENRTMFYLFPALKFKLKPEVFLGVGSQFAISDQKEFDNRFLVQLDIAW